jgi:hypothetical protein
LGGTARSPHDLAEKIHLILMHKRFIFARGAGHDGYASGGVPVTGTLPELGQSQSAGLRPSKWHFTGTWAARLDPRTISLLWAWRRRSGVGAGIGVGVVGVESARNGGQVGPERSFVNCVDAADLRIPALKEPQVIQIAPRQVAPCSLAVPSPQARPSRDAGLRAAQWQLAGVSVSNNGDKTNQSAWFAAGVSSVVDQHRA